MRLCKAFCNLSFYKIFCKILLKCYTTFTLACFSTGDSDLYKFEDYHEAYKKVMSANGKDKSWKHFRSCKAFVKFLDKDNITKGMIHAQMYKDIEELDIEAPDQSDFDPDDVYSSVMEAAGRKASLRHFERNKPMLNIVSSRGGREYVAKMGEEEKKEFYKGVYKCFLFKE